MITLQNIISKNNKLAYTYISFLLSTNTNNDCNCLLFILSNNNNNKCNQFKKKLISINICWLFFVYSNLLSVIIIKRFFSRRMNSHMF